MFLKVLGIRSDNAYLVPNGKSHLEISPNGYKHTTYTNFLGLLFSSFAGSRSPKCRSTSNILEVLHVFRSIPSFFILASRVVGFIPNIFAAPCSPLTVQRANSSAFEMC